ncbi:hypothetical protein JG688_00007232 [Phytophthora aleatoria]|uniref:Uncharacterized protein n=1 Tax=Phytophthora aleatoria TaxID=2496075 RepID=A0A8J5IKE1_9STRA|nr:hypothetical protein JG688_00007232 [Phytophthora aleatoria]
MEDSNARCRCVGGALNFVDSVVADIIGNPSTNFEVICDSLKVNLKCFVEEGTSPCICYCSRQSKVSILFAYLPKNAAF